MFLVESVKEGLATGVRQTSLADIASEPAESGPQGDAPAGEGGEGGEGTPSIQLPQLVKLKLECGPGMSEQDDSADSPRPTVRAWPPSFVS